MYLLLRFRWLSQEPDYIRNVVPRNFLNYTTAPECGHTRTTRGNVAFVDEWNVEKGVAVFGTELHVFHELIAVWLVAGRGVDSSDTTAAELRSTFAVDILVIQNCYIQHLLEDAFSLYVLQSQNSFKSLLHWKNRSISKLTFIYT